MYCRLMMLLYVSVLFVIPLSAQTSNCPTMVQTALDMADEVCAATGRNEMCYGHADLNASPRAGAPTYVFEQAGDLVALASVERLQLSAMDSSAATWGIALLKVQANLPETIPGQNVTMILFGDVQAQNLAQDVRIPMMATSGVNVRRRPTTTVNNVIASLRVGQVVSATGKLDDWIRVRLEDGTDGWVSADFLDGDSSELPVVTSNDAVSYGPMSAFMFRSGIGDSPCMEAPSSGILIQTPHGAGRIRLSVNGVDILLGSTAYMQAQDYLYVSVLDGYATLTANGQTQLVPEGARGKVPLGQDGLASGAPGLPEPYTEESVRNLPVRLLPDAITIATPLREDDIQAAIDDLVVTTSTTGPGATTPGGGTGAGVPADGLYPSGIWQNTATVLANTCDPESIPVGQVGTAYPRLTFSEDQSSIFVEFGPDWGPFTYYRASDTTYISSNKEGRMILTMTFTSPTTYFQTHRGDYGGCIFYQDETGVFVGG